VTGHDSAINTIISKFIPARNRSRYLDFIVVSDNRACRIQEDVAAIGISSYNGGHIDFFLPM